MRKDLDLYLLQMADQIRQMNKIVDTANNQIQAGILKKEQAEQLFTQMNILNNNYQRVVYCEYLLHKKPKWIQQIMDALTGAKVPDFKAQKADQESVAAENREALGTMQQIVDSVGDRSHE